MDFALRERDYKKTTDSRDIPPESTEQTQRQSSTTGRILSAFSMPLEELSTSPPIISILLITGYGLFSLIHC